jgi:hypothetical protein
VTIEISLEINGVQYFLKCINEILPSPSRLKPRHRQLPLCLLVRHSVSIVPVPVESTLVLPSSSSSLFEGTEGNRKDWT